MSHLQFITHSFVLIALFVWVSPAAADTSSVVQSISVSAHTGGSSASGGTVTEGVGESRIDSTTVINGVVVEDVHQVSQDGPLELRTTYTSTTPQVVTDLRLRADTTPPPIPPIVVVRQERPVPVEESAVSDETITSTVEQTTAIIQPINKSVAEDVAHEKESEVYTTLFTQVMHSIRRAFTYVLSSIFSY